MHSELRDDNYSFWKYLSKAGEAMNTQRNIARYSGFNDESISYFLNKFFNSENLTKDLINHFFRFNLHLQLSLLFIALFAFFFIASVFIFFNNLRKCIIIGKSFNFYKLLLCTFLNLWGFFICKDWERSLWERKDPLVLQRSPVLAESELWNKFRRFRKKADPFRFKKPEDLIVVENLYFSPDLKHSSFKHLKDQFLFFKDNKEVNEKEHIHHKKTLWNKDHKYILKNINLTIKRGSFNVIIGCNGSGKTTLIKSLINLNENTTGRILWNGLDITKINKNVFARNVSYIPQFLNIYQSLKVVDFLSFARYPYKDNNEVTILKAIRDSGCIEFADKNLDSLSGGQKQKILLASILVQEADTIILDEPTSFLDIKNQHIFLESLKKLNSEGKTIIMILHDLQQAINYANNLIVMKEGEVYASGTPEEIINEELLRDVFNIGCKIYKNNAEIEIQDIYAIS